MSSQRLGALASSCTSRFRRTTSQTHTISTMSKFHLMSKMTTLWQSTRQMCWRGSRHLRRCESSLCLSFSPIYVYIFRNTFDHAVFILHTHSDDETGGLFYTSSNSETHTPLSTGIENVGAFLLYSHSKLKNHCQFFEAVVGDDMYQYLKGMKFSSLFLLSCGSVVQVESAREGLKRVVTECVSSHPFYLFD